MSRSKLRNLPASVRQRLYNRAQERHEDFGLVLTKYALERFLYRLSQSPYRDQFVLKGALLFELWTHRPYRPTRDLDLSGPRVGGAARIRKIFGDILGGAVEDDGLVFDSKSIRITRIREEEEYQGLRVTFLARLERARIPLQVDIGFDDAIVPAPEEIQFPGMLAFPTARLRAYPKETVVAEKLEALVKLGMANTRMKDFYDLSIMAREFEFAGPALCKAIDATFKRRQTQIPATVPLPLTEEFSKDPQKARQWRAFLKKSSLDQQTTEFNQVIADLATFVMPLFAAIRASDPFHMAWAKNGPWAPEKRQFE